MYQVLTEEEYATVSVFPNFKLQPSDFLLLGLLFVSIMYRSHALYMSISMYTYLCKRILRSTCQVPIISKFPLYLCILFFDHMLIPFIVLFQAFKIVWDFEVSHIFPSSKDHIRAMIFKDFLHLLF